MSTVSRINRRVAVAGRGSRGLHRWRKTSCWETTGSHKYFDFLVYCIHVSFQVTVFMCFLSGRASSVSTEYRKHVFDNYYTYFSRRWRCGLALGGGYVTGPDSWDRDVGTHSLLPAISRAPHHHASHAAQRALCLAAAALHAGCLTLPSILP